MHTSIHYFESLLHWSCFTTDWLSQGISFFTLVFFKSLPFKKKDRHDVFWYIPLKLYIAIRVTAFLITLFSAIHDLPRWVLGGTEHPCSSFNTKDLPLDQLAVKPFSSHEFSMCPLIYYTAIVDHNDVVGPLHRTQTMGDHQHCVFLHDIIQGLLNLR